MTYMAPLDPFQGKENADDGIPAADPGRGAPETSEGFGVGPEDADLPEEGRPPADAGGQHADPPFRTPDPEQVAHDRSR